MNKKNIRYLFVWGVLVALFNVICFVLPDEINRINESGGSFWVGYIFIMATFFGHLIHSYIILLKDSLKDNAINQSLGYIDFTELVIMVAVGSVCMFNPGVPNWMGIIICSVVLAFSILYSVSARTVSENSINTNYALNERTSKMRDLIAQAKEIYSKTSNEENKEQMRELYEALRYSDISSYCETLDEEDKIKSILYEISNMIRNPNDSEKIREKIKMAMFVVKQRNNKCQLLKRKNKEV